MQTTRTPHSYTPGSPGRGQHVSCIGVCGVFLRDTDDFSLTCRYGPARGTVVLMRSGNILASQLSGHAFYSCSWEVEFFINID